MPNLNLTHSGNMNITSASIGSGGTLNVQYEPNNTGYVTGYTVTPELTEVVCGQTYDITFYPKFSGTVLTETFTVSGVDESGVRRSDSAVLRQGFDTDYNHYYDGWGNVPSYAFPDYTRRFSDRFEIRIPITGGVGNNARLTLFCEAGKGDAYTWQIPIVAPSPGPDTGTVASSLTLVVDDTITDYGQASAIYSPSNAYVDLHYYAYDIVGDYLHTSTAVTINETTGEITVLANGTVRICVEDTISNRRDCENVEVVKTGPEPPTPDTGVTALTISVADEIIENGIAVPIFSPSTAETSFVFTSSDDSIATIDSGGNITVLDNGLVTFCVEETISGMRDCKEVSVRKAVYIDSIEIVVDDIDTEGVASAYYTPTEAIVSLVYTSSDPDIASIDANTGVITVHQTGNVTFCVRDLYTNKSDCKTVFCLYEVVTVNDYFTVVVERGGTLVWKLRGERIFYRINNAGWVRESNAEKTLNVNTGDVIEFYYDGVGGSLASGHCGIERFLNTSTCTFRVRGNIMSLISQDFANLTTIKVNNAFYHFFDGVSGLTKANKLLLPATTLKNGCYLGMFYHCHNLVKPPQLPATTLAEYCYCDMFYYCISLVQAPELSATTLVNYCYSGMFYYCRNLSYIKCLATEGFNSSSPLRTWVSNVSSTGTFVQSPNATSWTIGNDGIPYGWTVVDAT